MASRAVFEQVLGSDPPRYDLKVDRRIREYDVDADDIQGALRRARLPAGTEVYVEDESGYRTRLSH